MADIESLNDAVANSLIETGLDRSMLLLWPSAELDDEREFDLDTVERDGNVITADYIDIDNAQAPVLEVRITVEVTERGGSDND